MKRGKLKPQFSRTAEQEAQLSTSRATKAGVERGAELTERARVIHWLRRANVFAPSEIHVVRSIADSIEGGHHALWCKANKVGQ